MELGDGTKKLRARKRDQILPKSFGRRSEFTNYCTELIALLASAVRQGFGGELNVELGGLPAGVTLQTVPMAAFP